MTNVTAKPSLRQSMDYLHTWAGVLFSALLFVVFFMGTLSVFDREIDRWMMPSTRVAQPGEVSFDRMVRPHLEELAPNSTLWSVQYPFEREPVMRLNWNDGGGLASRYVDINTGRVLPEAGTKGGTGFFYPFHYSFHLEWMDIGYWLLALVAIAMLALLVSGVIIHKKIFADFFTFRPGKSAQRAMLDLHNASSVLLLPFHFIITLSGLIIFLFIYMKPGISLIYGKDAAKAAQEAFGLVVRASAGQPGQLASLDAMVVQARDLWDGGGVHKIIIRNPQDKNAVVEIQRRPHDRISHDTLSVAFDGASGAILSQQHLSPTLKVQRFFSGLHMIPADHWWLRWLYFVMGLISCLMIGSGMLLWVEKRRIRHEKKQQAGYRVVNAVAVAATLGLLVSTLSMLIANKILPSGIPARAELEQWCFFASWFLALAHSLVRASFGRRKNVLCIAWREQAWVSAVLAVVGVFLNAAVTGDHLLLTMARGEWAIAGTDLVLLAVAALAALSARKLTRQTLQAEMGMQRVSA